MDDSVYDPQLWGKPYWSCLMLIASCLDENHHKRHMRKQFIQDIETWLFCRICKKHYGQLLQKADSFGTASEWLLHVRRNVEAERYNELVTIQDQNIVAEMKQRLHTTQQLEQLQLDNEDVKMGFMYMVWAYRHDSPHGAWDRLWNVYIPQCVNAKFQPLVQWTDDDIARAHAAWKGLKLKSKKPCKCKDL